MLKVILTKGIPASGKTTWAKKFMQDNPNYKRVNKDELRHMIDFDEWNPKNEKMILKIRDNLILTFLAEGFNIIIDDTNLSEKHFDRVNQLVKGIATVEINKKFLKVSVEECIKRDKNRKNSVGEKVILNMAKSIDKNFILPKPKFEYDPKLYSAIIVDIDGTLALHYNRSPYNYDKCDTDILNVPVANLLDFIQYKIILVSGRNEWAREKTIKWLIDNGVYFDFLFMRKNNDNRPDFIIKKEIYENNIKGKMNIRFILDDRNQVVKMWREEGLTVFQVADGNF